LGLTSPRGATLIAGKTKKRGGNLLIKEKKGGGGGFATVEEDEHIRFTRRKKEAKKGLSWGRGGENPLKGEEKKCMILD